MNSSLRKIKNKWCVFCENKLVHRNLCITYVHRHVFCIVCCLRIWLVYLYFVYYCPQCMHMYMQQYTELWAQIIYCWKITVSPFYSVYSFFRGNVEMVELFLYNTRLWTILVIWFFNVYILHIIIIEINYCVSCLFHEVVIFTRSVVIVQLNSLC